MLWGKLEYIPGCEAHFTHIFKSQPGEDQQCWEEKATRGINIPEVFICLKAHELSPLAELVRQNQSLHSECDTSCNVKWLSYLTLLSSSSIGARWELQIPPHAFVAITKGHAATPDQALPCQGDGVLTLLNSSLFFLFSSLDRFQEKIETFII